MSRARRVLLHASGQPVVQVLLEELLSRQRSPQPQKGEGSVLKFSDRDIFVTTSFRRNFQFCLKNST